MAFELQNFSSVGAASSASPTIFTYATDDPLSEVNQVGYFPPQANILTGDIIFTEIDGVVYQLYYQDGKASPANDASVLIKSREIFVDDDAPDENKDIDIGGKSPQYPVNSLNDSVSLVMALNPPPALFNGASIGGQTYSRYVESVKFPDNVQVNVSESTIQGEVKAGSNAQLKAQVITTNGTGGEIAYSTDGSSRVGLTTDAIIANGVGDICISIDGATDGVFIRNGQSLVRADNSRCISYTASGNNAEGINFGVADIGDAFASPNSCTALYIDNGSDTTVFTGNAIKAQNDGNHIGVEIVNGSAILDIPEIRMDINDTAAVVRSGTTFTLNTPKVTGNIFVESGGLLEVDITAHQGFVLPLGTINGQIAGVEYGSYVNGTELQFSRTRPGNVQGSPQPLGYIQLNMDTDTLNAIEFSYTQTTGGSRQYDFTIRDANNLGTIYFAGSYASFGAGIQTFNANLVGDAVTPLPGSGEVLLYIQQARTGAGGLNTGQCTIQVTRV
ncbi:MAG: hypothetical protein GY746_10815 [Gammaproteobacteria bacterium]|nr:hypothetical protein [Gammaproteobacteria bacterium]